MPKKNAGQNRFAPEKTDRRDYLVTGIAAARGGRALADFFSAVPAASGCAFVLALPLAPSDADALRRLTEERTALSVVEVRGEPVAIEPDRVYFVSAQYCLTIVGETLQRRDAPPGRARSGALDLFFRELAAAFGPRAVGVVISGADGLLGLRAIKEQNGFVFVRSPDEAGHDALGRGAIAANLADLVLPSAAMPARLAALRPRAARLAAGDFETAGKTASAPRLREILSLLEARTGHDFSNYKTPTLLRRIARRMQIGAVDELDDYVGLLCESGEEIEALLGSLLITVTHFFRDPETFAALEKKIVPRLFADRTAKDAIRVWSVGCATGEEAYALAMLLAEAAARVSDPPKIQIFATDIDEGAIGVAREGCFPEAVEMDVSPARLRRFFIKEGDLYRVKKHLREMIVFAPHNVLRDPPFSRLDLVSCRNLLIYLNRETQETVLKKFFFALRADGFLLLGNTETADSCGAYYEPVEENERIYARRAAFTEKLSTRGAESFAGRGGPADFAPPGFSYGALHQQLIERLAPPSVLVDDEFEVLHLSDSVGRFLNFSGGEPSTNLLKIIHADLLSDLRAVLFAAREDDRPAACRNIAANLGGVRRLVDLSVRPLEAGARLLLVLIEEKETVPDPDEQTSAAAPADRAIETVIRRLEEELRRTKDRLRATIIQHESSIDELKSSNEELQAINNELRTATAELETSKEEMQSVNEELIAVNHELKVKIDETSKANSDLQNLMTATRIATVFLDRELSIKRFTPAAAEIFNIIASDVGRPLADLTNRLDYEELTADSERALASAETIEREVRSRDDRHFISRVLPYRTLDDRIDGVVLNFIDVTRRKRAEERLRASEERLRLLIESATDYAIFTMTPDGTIDSWNAGAENVFGWSEAEAVGQKGNIIFTPEDRAAGAPAHELETARREGRAADERWHVRRDDSRLYVSGVVSALQERDGLAGFVKIARDLTERQHYEEVLREGDRRKDEFLATLAHELRNPLAPVRTGLEIVRRSIADRETVERTLGIVERQTRQIVHLVDDLLDISRITQGKIKLRRETVELAAAIELALETSRGLIEKHGHEFSLAMPAERLYVRGDATRLAQVFLNLLNNAAKYTKPGGKISLAAAVEGGAAVVRVVDNGFGIPPALLPRIFEMFGQIVPIDEQPQSGLGIGLSVVKKLVEMHGGTVEAISEGEGRGSEFVVRLPLIDKPPASPSPAAVDAAPAAAHKTCRILAVDDNVDAVRMLEVLLRLEGHQVATAIDGRAALRTAAEFRPQAALLDIGLPEMNGYELARRLRADYPEILLIAVSGWGREEDRRRSQEAGFDHHLVKPVSFDELQELLNKRLEC